MNNYANNFVVKAHILYYFSVLDTVLKFHICFVKCNTFYDYKINDQGKFKLFKYKLLLQK